MFERIKFNSISSDKRECKSYNYLKLKLEIQIRFEDLRHMLEKNF